MDGSSPQLPARDSEGLREDRRERSPRRPEDACREVIPTFFDDPDEAPVLHVVLIARGWFALRQRSSQRTPQQRMSARARGSRRPASLTYVDSGRNEDGCCEEYEACRS